MNSNNGDEALEAPKASEHQDTDLIDAITLIADFLERSTPLHETATLLRREVVSKHLLPDTTTWNGQPIPGSLPNPRLLRALPKDHLIRSLRMLTMTPTNSATAIAPTTTSSSSSLLLSTAAAMQSKQGNMQQQRKQARVEIQSLVALRDEQRRLQREMQSDKGRSSQSLSAAILVNDRAISNKLKEIGSFLLQVLAESSVSHSLQLRQLDPSSMTSSSNRRNRAENDHAKERLICSQYRVLKKIQGHRGPAYCLSASHPQWIFTGADDGLVRMWNPQTSRLHCAYRGNRQVVTDICHTNDLIASAAGDNSTPVGVQQDNTVRIWEISTTKLFACITQHKKPVQRVQFSPDETLLFSSAEDGTCAVWDVDSLRRQTQDRDRTKKVWMDREREKRQRSTTADFTEQDEIQLELDCAVVPLQIDPPLVFPHCKSKSGHGTDYKPVPLVCMAVHPSGKFVATGCEDALGRVWSLAEISGAKCAPAASVPGMLSGQYRDGSRHLVCILTGHTTGFVHHIEFSHRGDRILTFSDKDGTARVWFWPMARGVAGNDFTSKPQQIILKAMMASDVERGHKKQNQHPLIHAAAFSQCDDLVITSQSLKPSMYEGETAFWDSRVCVWDSRTGALLRFMRGHRMQAPIIRMHPELNWLGATCGMDGLILFWDFTTGEEIKRLDCISSEGYAGVCDAKWCNSSEQHSAVDFAVTDSMHRLCLIGTGEESVQSRANPPDQFLSNEMGEIIYRALTLEPMDAVLQLPLHLMHPAPRMVDAYGDAYAHQPPPLPQGQGSYFAPVAGTNVSNFRLRIEQAEELTKAIRKKEMDARDVTAMVIAKQEQLIALAVEQDVKLEEEKRLRPAAAAAAAVAGTGSRAATAARRPKRQTQSTPMWALERAALTLSSDTEEEEEVVSQEVQNGRKRRRAALRANRSIHRHTRHLVDQQQQQTPSRARNSTVRIHDNDDEEEDDPVEYVQSDAGNGSSEDEDEYAEDERLRFIVDDNDEIRLLSDDDDEDDFDDDEEGDDGKKKRRRYKTRGKRTDYSRFYDGRPTATDEAATTVSLPQQQQPPQQQPVSPVKQFSDEWLTSNTEPALLVPQRGDQVVYFPQGHLEYLNRFPSSMAPPWHAWDTREWPYVLCQVDDVDYTFPSLQQDEIHHVLCRVTLRVIQVKAPANSEEFFIPVEDTSITFTLEFHPFGNEFLVLYQRFLHSMQPIFLPGTLVKCIYISEDTLEVVPYEAEVVAIAERDPANWPESPWEAVECRFVDDDSFSNEPSFFSPWDIEPINSSTASMSSSTTTTTTTVAIPKMSLHTQDFWALEHEGKPVGEWIASQIQSCTFPLFTLSKRKLGKSPIDLSIGLVCERLVSGKYYRQWEAIEADLERAVEYTTGGKDTTSKSKQMLFEFREILQIARGTLPSSRERVDWQVFQHALLQALENTMRADREGFFAQPVDADEVPDYYEIITNPMDFSTIHAFCAEAEAPNCDGEGNSATFPEARGFIREVVAKIKLMALNAMTYNAETSLVFRRAKEVVKKMTNEFHDLKARVLVTRAEELEESASDADEEENDGIAELTSDEEDVHHRNKRRGTKYALRIRAPPPQAQLASRGRRNTRSLSLEKDDSSPPQRVTTRRRSKAEEEEDVISSEEEESADEGLEDDDVFEEEEEEETPKPLRTKRPSKTSLPQPSSSDEEEEETSRHSRSSRYSRASSQHGEEDDDGARVLRKSTRAKPPRSDPNVEERIPIVESSRSRSKPIEVIEELPPPTRSGSKRALEQQAVKQPYRKRTRAHAPVVNDQEEEEEKVLSVSRSRRSNRTQQQDDDHEVVTRRTTRGRAKTAKRDDDDDDDEVEVIPAPRPRRSSSSAQSVSFNNESSEEEEEKEHAPSKRRRISTRSSTTTVESEEKAPRSRRPPRANKPVAIVIHDDDEEEVIPQKRRGSSRRRRNSSFLSEEESEKDAPARRTRSSTASSIGQQRDEDDDDEEEEKVVPKSRARKHTSTVETRKVSSTVRRTRRTKPSSSEDETTNSSSSAESFEAESDDEESSAEEEEEDSD